MNTFKNVFRACNGTRIAQCSLLIALAFLCLAIVFMCVFYNLNALATNNIAFAEDEVPTRIMNDGFYDEELLPLCFGQFWTGFNYTLNNSSYNTDNLIYQDTYYQVYAYGVGTIVDNIVSSGVVIRFNVISNLFYQPTSIRLIADFNGFTSKVYSSTNNWTSGSMAMQSFNYGYRWSSSVNQPFGYVGDFIEFTFNTNISISKFWLSNTFNGFVDPSYHYYGYDVGYRDGVASQQSGSPIPSSGIVRDNLLNDNDFSSASYNISLSQQESRDVRSNRSSLSAEVFNGSNFRLSLNTTSSASLINNHFTTGTSTADLYFGVNEKTVPLIERDKYTLAFCFSHMTLNYSGIVVSVGFNGTAYRSDVIDATDGSLYWTFTFDLTSSTQNLNYFYFSVTIPDNSTLDLEWFKLEKGDSFSGYVPKAYKLYGYNDGYDLGYDAGYSDAFVYSLWTSGVGVIPSDLINDNVSIVTSDYVSSVSALSVDNQAHTYSPPARIGTYIDFSTIPAGASLKFDCSVTFTNVSSTTIHYYFADADYNDADWLYNNSDGSFANGSSDFILVCPRIASRLYFVSYVSETVGFQVAGLPYYKVFDFKIENENGNNIISSIVLDLDETFDEVRNTAYDNGFRDGQIKGESSHEYSFMSLFGAIYDVPVNAFNNMFNFDVFGVNFRAILLGLITLALGLFIWKIIVRGG